MVAKPQRVRCDMYMWKGGFSKLLIWFQRISPAGAFGRMHPRHGQLACCQWRSYSCFSWREGLVLDPQDCRSFGWGQSSGFHPHVCVCHHRLCAVLISHTHFIPSGCLSPQNLEVSLGLSTAARAAVSLPPAFCQVFVTLSPLCLSPLSLWELSPWAFQASSIFMCQQGVFTGLKYSVGLCLSANPWARWWSARLLSATTHLTRPDSTARGLSPHSLSGVHSASDRDSERRKGKLIVVYFKYISGATRCCLEMWKPGQARHEESRAWQGELLGQPQPQGAGSSLRSGRFFSLSSSWRVNCPISGASQKEMLPLLRCFPWVSLGRAPWPRWRSLWVCLVCRIVLYTK